MKNHLSAAVLILLFCGTAVRAASTIQFSTATYTVAESAGSVSVQVRRTDDLTEVVTVDYATADSTATNGMDYAAVSGTLSFGAGETNRSIPVPVVDDGFVAAAKQFKVLLLNPGPGAVLGGRTNATVIISNNDFGIQFEFSSYSVGEEEGSIQIAVVRGDDGTQPVMVDLFTSDVTAINGQDYLGFTNQLAFQGNERFKLISIPILNNDFQQLVRTFNVTLANPTNATLGNTKSITVRILDNDPGFQFELAAYSVSEDAGVFLINVLRGTDDTKATATVDVTFVDGTATNGMDYFATNATLAFDVGEKSKAVSVQIQNDGVKQGSRGFVVNLTNPSTGAVLSTRNRATVTIVNNDGGVGFGQPTYTVSKRASTVLLTVLRGNDVNLWPFTVNFATSDSSAKAGIDYEAVSGVLEFKEYETIKTITIPILTNGSSANNANFLVKLSDTTAGMTLGIVSATVSLQGNSMLSFLVAPPFETELRISNEDGLKFLNWEGGGQLQRADGPDGPWQPLPNARSPLSIASTVPSSYYRVTRPRTVQLYVPSTFSPGDHLPLVILLHGYSSTGAQHEGYMQFQRLAETKGFLYCYPEGTKDHLGNQFWNATDGCCDIDYTGVDDAHYLLGLIQEIISEFGADPKRVFLIGHSNGGFMANRMACEFADVIAGIASLAGPTYLNPDLCKPSQPVNILHIHGTADADVFYWGGAGATPRYVANMPAAPGAFRHIQYWADYNGATGLLTDPAPTLDLTTDVAGLDIIISRYTNAPPGGAVELWTIVGGIHGPALSAQFSPKVIDWLFAHPKP